MKKLLAFIASFAIMLVVSSSFVDKRREAVLGETAPSLVLGNGDSVLSLASLQGSWVILSFWSAADARSRMMQNQVAAYIRSREVPAQANGVEVVSVNFDHSERLMREIVRLDNLDENSQFHVDNGRDASVLRQSYRMNEGLRTFLINPAGEIVAADPTVADLHKHIG